MILQPAPLSVGDTRQKESGIKDLFGGEICTVMSPVDFEQEGVIPEIVFHIFEKLVFLPVGRHSLDNEFPFPTHGSLRNLQTNGVLSTRRATGSKSFGEKCFRDFLVSVILMRVLKSGKMIGGQIFCSFFVSDDNIEFLEQKDPPHQSWLSILFSEEILYQNGRLENLPLIHLEFEELELDKRELDKPECLNKPRSIDLTLMNRGWSRAEIDFSYQEVKLFHNLSLQQPGRDSGGGSAQNSLWQQPVLLRELELGFALMNL
ncbi:hypothetical protein Tco_1284403 [Tanacetum coccineum]